MIPSTANNDDGNGNAVGSGSRTSTMTSSSSVMLDAVDDYLAPSQACINPLFQPQDKDTGNDKDKGQTKTGNTGKAGGRSSKSSSAAMGAVVVPRRKRRITRPKLAVVDPPTTRSGVGKGTTNPGMPSSTSSTPPSSSMSTRSIDNLLPSKNKLRQNQQKAKEEADPIKASIADCLACSGCVTTAETVLLEQEHSLTKLRQTIAKSATRTHLRTLTISSASWADILRVWEMHSDKLTGAHNRLHRRELYAKRQRQFATLLHRILNVDVVVDGTVPLRWSRQQAAIEFCDSYRSKKQANRDGSPPTTTTIPAAAAPPPPSIAVHADKTLLYDGKEPNGTPVTPSDLQRMYKEGSAISAGAAMNRPQIASACPAVVCLIEKSIPALVPLLASTKSPMSMVGAAITHNVLANNTERSAGNSHSNALIEHWAIMPCHDKKLEASRKDFWHALPSTARVNGADANGIGTQKQAPPVQKEVDLVLTTNECMTILLEWIEEQSRQQHEMLDDPMDIDSGMVDVTQPKHDSLSNGNVAKSNHQTLFRMLDELSLAETIGHRHLMKELQDVCNETESNATSMNRNAKLLTVEQGEFAVGASNAMGVDAGQDTAIKTDSATASTIDPYASGAHADYIFRYACQELFQFRVPRTASVWQHQNAAAATNSATSAEPIRSARLANRRKRSQDYFTATLLHSSVTNKYKVATGAASPAAAGDIALEDEAGPWEPVLKFAIANGMQTLQRVLTPLGEGPTTTSTKDALDYIEAMACPSGCINGGGQIRMASTTTATATKQNQFGNRETPTQTRQRVAATRITLQELGSHETTRVSKESTCANDIEGTIPEGLVVAGIPEALQKHQEITRTCFHVVPPMQHTMGAAAGVAVQDMVW